MQNEEYGKVSYKKLFIVMAKRKIKKIDLRKQYGIHAATVSRLVNDQSVNIEIIAQLCEILQCQPGDILSFTDIEGKEPQLKDKFKVKTAVKERM